MYTILSHLIVFFFFHEQIYIYIYILKKINCRDSKAKKKKNIRGHSFFFLIFFYHFVAEISSFSWGVNAIRCPYLWYREATY